METRERLEAGYARERGPILAWLEQRLGAEALEALYTAIELLPAEQRSVIVAQAIRGETFASISKTTGIPIETLAARKRYALAKLKAALAEYA